MNPFPKVNGRRPFELPAILQMRSSAVIRRRRRPPARRPQPNRVNTERTRPHGGVLLAEFDSVTGDAACPMSDMDLKFLTPHECKRPHRTSSDRAIFPGMIGSKKALQGTVLPNLPRCKPCFRTRRHTRAGSRVQRVEPAHSIGGWRRGPLPVAEISRCGK